MLEDNNYCCPLLLKAHHVNKSYLNYLHTGNIGLSRDYNHRWITQYSALFCVLNSYGQVVTWQLTSSLSFSTVEVVMQNLNRRLHVQGKNVKEFYVDNCCSWRNKLKSVFGEDLKVYLDVFHAVQRIGQKIPKRHPLRNECMNDLRLVFRHPSDLARKGPRRLHYRTSFGTT